jgi:hypothetical protein
LFSKALLRCHCRHFHWHSRNSCWLHRHARFISWKSSGALRTCKTMGNWAMMNKTMSTKPWITLFLVMFTAPVSRALQLFLKVFKYKTILGTDLYNGRITWFACSLHLLVHLIWPNQRSLKIVFYINHIQKHWSNCLTFLYLYVASIKLPKTAPFTASDYCTPLVSSNFFMNIPMYFSVHTKNN